MSIYVSMLRGTADTSHVGLGLFSPSGEAIIGSTMTVSDWGMGQADFPMELQGIKFDEAGVYDLRLFVADYVLAQRKLVVQTAPPPPPEQVDSPTS